MEEALIPKKRKHAEAAPVAQGGTETYTVKRYALRDKLSGLFATGPQGIGKLDTADLYHSREEADAWRNEGQKPSAEEVVEVECVLRVA